MTVSDTPTNDALTALIGRLEKLAGPDRECDCLIFEMRHRLLTPKHRGMYYGAPTGQYFDASGNILPEVAPRYTESLDAAVTLYRVKPDTISTNPVKVCSEALKARRAS